jgi:hypothetical protein
MFNVVVHTVCVRARCACSYNGLVDAPYAHLGDMCADHPPRTVVGGRPVPWGGANGAQRIGELTDPIKRAYAMGGSDRLGVRRLCCDCTHYCHSPTLWDEVLLTPLVHALRQLRSEHRPGGRPAHPS